MKADRAPGPAAPPARRATIRREPGALVVEYRVARRPLVPLFLAAWLVAWFFGERDGFVRLLSPGEDEAGRAFLGIWLAGWTAGGLVTLGVLLFSLAGREITRVGEGALSLRWAAGPFGWTRRFDLAAVRDLRFEDGPPAAHPAAAPPVSDLDSEAAEQVRGPRGRMPSALAFDYRRGTIRFATGISAAEAEVVLAALAERVPLARRDAAPVPR